MNRPVMNPTYLELPEPPKPRWRPFRFLARAAWGTLTFDVLRLLGRRPVADPDPLLSRAIFWLISRSAALLCAVIGLISAMVYFGTHVPTDSFGATPASQGIFYDQVPIVDREGETTEAWLIPVLDASSVLAKRESALAKKSPACVLVHDFAQGREQMLPLVRPLHEQGVVVLVIAMRGTAGGPPGGHTFGLLESRQVEAAVAMLSQRAYVDPKRIAVVGVGTGATAALLAAESAALNGTGNWSVAVTQPLTAGDDILDRVGPPADSWAYAWLARPCKWAFELCYNVDAEVIDAERSGRSSRPDVMVLKELQDSRSVVLGRHDADQLAAFVTAKLAPQTPAVADIKDK